jgi:mRNA interferase RelE/StbE
VGTYELRLAAPARRSLLRLPEFAATAVAEFITGPLLEDPYRVGRPLGKELEGYYGARRGTYRVLYRIVEDQRLVRVTRIDHRADVYRPR